MRRAPKRSPLADATDELLTEVEKLEKLAGIPPPAKPPLRDALDPSPIQKGKPLHLDRLAVVIFVFLAVFALATTSTATAPVSQWRAYFDPQVTYGSPIIGFVQGPPHSNFTVYLFAQPYNTSSPIFSLSFNFTSNLTNRTIAIPTDTLYVGSYQVVVDTVAANFAYIVRVVDALNATQILANMTALQSQQIALEGQILAEQSTVDTVQGQLYWAIYVVVFAMIYVTVVDSVKAYVTRKPGAARRLRKGWTNLWEELPYRTHAKGWEPLDTVEAATPDPERVWISGFCDKCHEILWTEAAIRQHIVEVHEIPEPVRGEDYWLDTKAVERARVSALAQPATGAAKKAQSWNADLSDIRRRQQGEN